MKYHVSCLIEEFYNSFFFFSVVLVLRCCTSFNAVLTTPVTSLLLHAVLVYKFEVPPTLDYLVVLIIVIEFLRRRSVLFNSFIRPVTFIWITPFYFLFYYPDWFWIKTIYSKARSSPIQYVHFFLGSFSWFFFLVLSFDYFILERALRNQSTVLFFYILVLGHYEWPLKQTKHY